MECEDQNMSHQAGDAPTFIETIISAAVDVRDGRGHRDVIFHAVTELGELAEEVRIKTGNARGKTAGPDGIAGEALDLVLCLVDYLRLLDHLTSDSRMVSVLNEKSGATGISFVQFFFECLDAGRPVHLWDHRDHLLSIAEDVGLLCGVRSGPFPDEIRAARYAALRAIEDCLRMIMTEIPDMSEASLIKMAEPKLEKWISHASVRA